MRVSVDRESLKSLAVVVGGALVFLVWGAFIFFAVGDKGSPSWEFGAMQDVPGSSPYSTSAPAAAAKPGAVGEEVGVQHVEGKRKPDSPVR